MVLPLVLGVVGAFAGTALGGGILTSIGYVVGSLIGNMLSPTKGPDRVGPRLEDLSLQTSSAVADLPRAYGTVGHMGNMIWAKGNQLQEVITTSTQKKKVLGFTVAKQKTTTYTYFLTCAVAFCKVPEGGSVKVLRIWMGDTLVYNASNDDPATLLQSAKFAEQITIYPGTDDQPIDPTIAADVGEENASAYPAIFYIVLRDFELTDYLNSVARAAMKVEYSVDVAEEGGLEFLNQAPLTTDPEYPALHNANFMDNEGLHVWTAGPADSNGEATTHTKRHFVALPGIDNVIQKQVITDAAPAHLVDDMEYLSLNMPAKGRGNTNVQVFTTGFVRMVSDDAGEAGLNPIFSQGPAVLDLLGFGWSAANFSYGSIVGTSAPFAPYAGSSGTWYFNSFGDALTSIRNICGGPGMLVSQPSFDEYTFNPTTQVLIPGGMFWRDPGPPLEEPRFSITSPTATIDIPYPLTEEHMEEAVYQQWLSAMVIAPGYSQEYRIILDSDGGPPQAPSFFTAYGSNVYVGFAYNGDGYVYRLSGLSSDAVASFSDTDSVTLHRLGIVNELVHALYDTTTGFVLKIYDLDLVEVDSLDAAAILAVFGSNGDEFADSLSFDFTRYYWLNSGDLYSKTSLAADPLLLGDMSATVIEGTDYPAFFGMTRRGNVLAVPTVGGSLPDTGIQFYTIGLIADPGKALLADIITEECKLAGLTESDIDVSLITDQVRGYRIAQRGSIRNVIGQLQTCFPFDVLQSGYKLKFVPRGQSPIASVSYDDLGKDVQWTQDREMTTQLPRRVVLRYLDRELEYEINEQYSERPIDSETETVIDIPIVLTPDEAAQMTDILHSVYLMERETYGPFTLPPTYGQVEPADVIVVTTSDGTTYQVRLTNVQYLPDGSMIGTGKRNAVTIYSSNAVGETVDPAPTVIPIAGVAVTEILDTPVNVIENLPGVTAVMGNPYESWTGGTLFLSRDGNWQAVQGFTESCTIAHAVDTLPEHSGAVVDRGNTLTIRIATGSITSTNETGLYNEVLLAAYGVNGRWEMVSVQNVTDNMDGTYTLDTFLRGLRGTEWATGLHETDDLFILLNTPDDVAFIELQTTDLNQTLTFRGVSNGGDIDSEFDDVIEYTGENLRPLSPVDAQADAVGQDLLVSWSRRDRVNAGWSNLSEIPMSEAELAFDVEILGEDDEVLRTVEVSGATSFTYTDTEQIEDFGEVIDSDFTVAIYQISALVGRGRPLITDIFPRGLALPDPLFSQVVFLAGFEGANGSTTIIDESSYARVMTPQGNAQITTTTPLMGSSSLLLDGTGDFVRTPAASELTIGTQQFTMECFVRLNSTSGTIAVFNQWDMGAVSTTRTWSFDVSSSQIRFVYNTGVVLTWAWSPVVGVTYHIAICRAGGFMRAFVNGVQVGASTADSGNISSSLTVLRVGGMGDGAGGTNNFLNGRLDECRITIGATAGRYTANFTPPALPFPRF